MFGFLADALRHLARQLVFGLIEDLIEWIRERVRDALRLDPAHEPKLLDAAQAVNEEDAFIGTAEEFDDDEGPLQLPRAA